MKKSILILSTIIFSSVVALAGAKEMVKVNEKVVPRCSVFIKNPFLPPSAAFVKAKFETVPFIEQILLLKGYEVVTSEVDANLVIFDVSSTARAHIQVIEQSTGQKYESNEYCDKPCWTRSVSLARALEKIQDCN